VLERCGVGGKLRWGIGGGTWRACLVESSHDDVCSYHRLIVAHVPECLEVRAMSRVCRGLPRLLRPSRGGCGLGATLSYSGIVLLTVLIRSGFASFVAAVCRFCKAVLVLV
jgi:hypothetical protein